MCVMYETAAQLSLPLPFLRVRARSLCLSLLPSPRTPREYRDFHENANAGLEFRFEKLDEELKDKGVNMDAQFKAIQKQLRIPAAVLKQVRVLAGDGRVQKWERWAVSSIVRSVLLFITENLLKKLYGAEEGETLFTM
jgi:hypothetical protein